MNVGCTVSNLNTNSNSIFLELVQNLLEPQTGKLWLQKTANLLKQYLNAKHLVLYSFVDNLFVLSSFDPSSSAVQKLELKRRTFKQGQNSCWINNKYIFPLSVEGVLEIEWENKPSEFDLAYKSVFDLVLKSIQNRASLIIGTHNNVFNQTLFKLENILNTTQALKDSLYLIVKELALSLDLSRCQIKIFSESSASLFENNLTLEFNNGQFLEAISIIPQFELDWISDMKSDRYRLQNKVINLPNAGILSTNEISKGIESLLSIKSFLGIPIFCKHELLGMLCLHQCDYERYWREDEIRFLKEVAFILSLVLSKELNVRESSVKDLSHTILDSDQFLRELNHAQLESQIKNSCFSLILIDIDRLKDINLESGFVAGNLVLGQTGRYLRRLFNSDVKIARYNSDEFVVILNNTDQNKARVEVERVKECLSNMSVLGVGPVYYNFSFVTFPLHTGSIQELLCLLEQTMAFSKSRGKLQISSYDELCGQGNKIFEKLVSLAIPEIISKKVSFKTGPDVIENIQECLARQKNGYSADTLDSVQSLVLALDAKDSYTEGHSKRVSEYAYMLGKSLGLDLQELEWIRLAAMMHDIGKIGIPESILCKPAKLTKDEFEVMKKHPVIGSRILKPIKPLEKVSNLVLYHHEYWEGSGYPHGLSKTEIPLGARIVSIVDAYQAMTSNRPYRASLTQEEAIKRLNEGKEKQWEPELVDAFIKIVT